MLKITLTIRMFYYFKNKFLNMVKYCNTILLYIDTYSFAAVTSLILISKMVIFHFKKLKIHISIYSWCGTKCLIFEKLSFQIYFGNPSFSRCTCPPDPAVGACRVSAVSVCPLTSLCKTGFSTGSSKTRLALSTRLWSFSSTWIFRTSCTAWRATSASLASTRLSTTTCRTDYCRVRNLIIF